MAQAPGARKKPRMAQHLTQWFGRLKQRLKKLHRAIAKAPKAKRLPLLLKLAKEYETIVRIHSLLVRRYETYKGSSMWPRLQKLQREARRQAALFRVKAAQLYQRLINEYQGDGRLCVAFYGLAKHLYALGKPRLYNRIYKAL